MRPELVIFDCDGVLVGSEAIVIEIEADMLTEAGPNDRSRLRRTPKPHLTPHRR